MQERFVGKRNQAVEAEHVERVVGAKRDLDAGDGPLELHAGRAVEYAVGGAEKRRFSWAEPVWKKPARTEIEEAGGFDAVPKRNAIFRIRSADEVCARGRRGICRGAGGASRLRERQRAEFAFAQAANELITGKETGIKRHVAAVAARDAEGGSKGPRIRGREKWIAENARGFAGRTEHVFVAAKNAAGNGIRDKNAFITGVMSPGGSERAAGSVRSEGNGWQARRAWRGSKCLIRRVA